MIRLRSLLLLFVFLAGCGGLKSCSPAIKKGESGLKTFVWNNHTEPATLDPGLMEDSASSNIGWQLYEGLCEYDPKTLEPTPGVATRWEASEEGLVYTYYLRKNAKWSDGSPVTAHDFEYSWKRVLNPKTASAYAYILYFVKNAEEYNNGKLKDDKEVGVSALDDHTLKVTLKYPTPFFPQVACFYTYRPVKSQTVEKWKDRWTRPEHFVSNGPYVLSSWIPQKEVLLKKNPHYWDKENVRIEEVKFLPIEDVETGLKLYLNGKVHFSDSPPYLKMDQLRKRPDFHDGPVLITYYYQINTTKGPLNNPKIRQALNSAIDKKVITEIMKKNDIPTTHLTPPGMDYEPPEGFGFDPKRGRELLAEAGFGEGSKFPKITIYYNTSENHKTIAELIQNMWKKYLGIDVALLNQEWKVLIDSYNSMNYEVGRMGWIGDYADPFTFLSLFTSTSQQNNTGWKNETYDDLVLNRSARETDPAKRNQILREAEKILLEELPILPLYHYNSPFLLDQRVKGFYANVKTVHPLKFAYFEEEAKSAANTDH